MEKNTKEIVLETEGGSTDLSLLFSSTGSFAKTVKHFAPEFDIEDELLDKLVKTLVMDNNFNKIIESYASKGLKVFPVDGASKEPAKGFKWRIVEQQGLEELMVNFHDYPANSVALDMCDDLETIDVDTKYDLDGDLWRNVKSCLYKVFGKNTPYVVQKTQSGGYHVIYRCSETEGSKKIASRVGVEGESKKLALVESKGKGGYILVSPSAGYEVIHGDLENIPYITPEQRAELWSLLASLDQMPKVEHKPRYDQKKLNGTSSFDGVSAWEDYINKADVVGLLEKHGWKICWAKPDKTTMTRPGKNMGVSAEYHHGLRKFYVWSTSTEFESEQPYDPYEIYTLLEHNGNFSSSAKELYKQGYGDRRTAINSPVEKTVEAKVLVRSSEEYKDCVLITVPEHEQAYPQLGIQMVVFQEESIDLSKLTDNYERIYLLLPDGIQDEVARRVGKHRSYKVILGKALEDSEEYPIEGLTTVGEKYTQLYDRFKNGVDRGIGIDGIQGLNKLMRFAKKGTVECITGTPGAGKSNFIDVLSSCVINELGWSVGYFSAETEVDDHITQISEKMWRKPFERLKEDEFLHSMEVLNEHLFYINSLRGEIKTVDGLLETAVECVLKHGIDMLVVDNMSLIDRSGKEGSQMRTNIDGIMAKFISFASTYQVKVFLVVHPRKMSKRMDGSYGDIEGYDLAESAAYFNLSDGMWSIERVSKDSYEVKIRRIKNRNKHTGKLGEIEVEWDYDLGGCYKEINYASSYTSKLREQQRLNKVTQEALDLMNK